MQAPGCRAADRDNRRLSRPCADSTLSGTCSIVRERISGLYGQAGTRSSFRLLRKAAAGSVHRQDRPAGAGASGISSAMAITRRTTGRTARRAPGPAGGAAGPLRPGRSRTFPVGARRRGSRRSPARAQGGRRRDCTSARPRTMVERCRGGSGHFTSAATGERRRGSRPAG